MGLPMNRDHEAESLLLALSRFEREAANRLGVPLALGPIMAAALAEKRDCPEQNGPRVQPKPCLVSYSPV